MFEKETRACQAWTVVPTGFGVARFFWWVGCAAVLTALMPGLARAEKRPMFRLGVPLTVVVGDDEPIDRLAWRLFADPRCQKSLRRGLTAASSHSGPGERPVRVRPIVVEVVAQEGDSWKALVARYRGLTEAWAPAWLARANGVSARVGPRPGATVRIPPVIELGPFRRGGQAAVELAAVPAPTCVTLPTREPAPSPVTTTPVARPAATIQVAHRSGIVGPRSAGVVFSSDWVKMTLAASRARRERMAAGLAAVDPSVICARPRAVVRLAPQVASLPAPPAPPVAVPVPAPVALDRRSDVSVSALPAAASHATHLSRQARTAPERALRRRLETALPPGNHVASLKLRKQGDAYRVDVCVSRAPSAHTWPDPTGVWEITRDILQSIEPGAKLSHDSCAYLRIGDQIAKYRASDEADPFARV